MLQVSGANGLNTSDPQDTRPQSEYYAVNLHMYVEEHHTFSSIVGQIPHKNKHIETVYTQTEDSAPNIDDILHSPPFVIRCANSHGGTSVSTVQDRAYAKREPFLFAVWYCKDATKGA